MLPGTRTLYVTSVIYLLFLGFTRFDFDRLVVTVHGLLLNVVDRTPRPAYGADRSDRRLFETRRLLEHASEHPASIRCRRLFEN